MPFPPKQPPQDPNAQAQPGMLPPAPAPPAQEVLFNVPEKEPGKNDPVDWYVDIDFPPIVLKDIKPYMESLKVLDEMMPGTPQSKKLVLAQALTAIGVNDVDQVLENLFPPLPEGVKPTGPVPTEMPGLLQQGPAMQPKALLPPGAKPKPLEPNPPGAPTRESVSPLRVHRFLTALREAADDGDLIIEGTAKEV